MPPTHCPIRPQVSPPITASRAQLITVHAVTRARREQRRPHVTGVKPSQNARPDGADPFEGSRWRPAGRATSREPCLDLVGDLRGVVT